MEVRAPSGKRQRGERGSYCWADEAGACCVDIAGDVYPCRPLVLAPGEKADLRFAHLGPVEHLSYRVRPHDPEEGAPTCGGPPAPTGTTREAELDRPAAPLLLPDDLPPGTYAVDVFVQMEEWGDTRQGFLLLVAPAGEAAATPAAGATPVAGG